MSRAKTGYRGKRAGYGRVGPHRIAWLRTLTTRQVILSEIDPEENDKDLEFTLPSEAGNSLVLIIPVPGRVNPLIWDITGMTGEELEATRQFFEFIFNRAEPTVKARDKAAEDAFKQGDDSFSRLYRGVPQFVVRERQQRTNSQGVLRGPEDSPSGDGSDEDQQV